MTAELRIIQQGIYDGKEAALASLHRLFHRRLFSFSKTITRSAEDSEEIVEDIFVKLWSNRHQVMSIVNLQVYLYVAIKNRSLNVLEKKSRELVHASFDDLDIDLASLAPDPHKLLVTADMMKKMQVAIDSLPPRCKMIFRLIREDGLPYREVAEILNISVNTIDVQMAIAVKKICQALHTATGFNAIQFRQHLMR